MNSEQRSRRPWFDWPTRNRHSTLGYVYGIAYSTGAVKVGSTLDPRRRADALRLGAAQFGATITDAWLSAPHGEYRANETRLHEVCAAIGPRWANETFAVSLHDVVAAAADLPMTDAPTERRTLSGAEARAAQRRENVRRLYHDEGYTLRMIAEELGCGLGTVHGDLRRDSA